MELCIFVLDPSLDLKTKTVPNGAICVTQIFYEYTKQIIWVSMHQFLPKYPYLYDHNLNLYLQQLGAPHLEHWYGYNVDIYDYNDTYLYLPNMNREPDSREHHSPRIQLTHTLLQKWCALRFLYISRCLNRHSINSYSLITNFFIPLFHKVYTISIFLTFLC